MSERIAVVDYGAGNLRSVANALKVAAAGLGREIEIDVTASADAVRTAGRVVLPGVGAFGQCAAALRAVPGMIAALEGAVRGDGRPFLGICVGMQLLAERGTEHGVHDGLGWLPGEVVRLEPADPALKVPHMGWAPVAPTDAGRAHPVVSSLADADQAYFVHSYHFVPAGRAPLLASYDYGGDVAAIVGRDNILGVQFHPEKSQTVGLGFLQAFLEWTP